MAIGLVLEGGGMRGMFTAGILDVMLQNDVKFDGVVGVSAGAAFGCNYKSRQIGRVIRYNARFCNDPRYVGFRSLITTGNLYNEEFCYGTVPRELDVFDTKTYTENPVKFYVTCTDVTNGQPIYHLCPNGDAHDIRWIQASASMPIVSRVVDVDGMKLLDGGISDSIPVDWMLSQGYDKCVVVLTQNEGYRKRPSHLVPMLCKVFLKDYPAIAEAMKRRHLMYNAELDRLKQLEAEGKVLIIRPSKPFKVRRDERNPDKLHALHALGVADGEACLDAVRNFLQH